MNHQINHDSGEGNVNPDGECNAGKPAMLFPVVFEGVIEGDENEGNHDDGQQHMGNQDAEIEGFDPAELRKNRAAVMIVISEVTHQKNRRENKSRNHEFLVSLFTFFLDGIISKDQADKRK